MNATKLSGGIRAGSILRRRRVQVSAPVVVQTPALSPAPSIGVAERGGVWCVVDQAGNVLAPCADERTARTHAGTLSWLSSLGK